MDNRRRNRRGRPRTRQPSTGYREPSTQKTSLFNRVCSFLITSCLIAIIFSMLEHHSYMCHKKCDMFNITRTLLDIEHNISTMKNSYNDLERSVMKFSHELPKIEGQVELLEALAHTMDRGDSILWHPKNHMAFPNVDVFIKTGTTKPLFNNNTIYDLVDKD